MNVAQLLHDAFERIRDSVHDVLEGLSEEELLYRPDDGANSISWLLWHLSRIQDDHVAEVAGTEQVWTSEEFAERFGLPFPASATGYGQSPSEAAIVAGDAALLGEYHDAVADATARFVASVDDATLERIVDTRFRPPVTLGVRLVSVITDDLQHVGQAAYLRGLVERRRGAA